MTKKSSSDPTAADTPEVDPFDAAIEAHEKDLAEIKAARIPPESGGIQINFCKNPTCDNFGKPEEGDIAKWSKKGQARYKVSSAGKAYPHLMCRSCGTSFPIKSNLGIHEELQRMQAVAEVALAEPSCPDEDCDYHGLGVSAGKPFYSSFGSTKAGSPRWKCMACSKTFSAAKSSTLRQRKSHKNKRIFEMLVNRVAMRRICEMMDIGPKALYDKIDFIYRQCEKFLSAREAKLPELSVRRLYLGVDRQDYQVNWTQREDRRNTVISAVATVDNETGYCFGLHLNFDPTLDPEAIEKSAHDARDYAVFPPFRKHARVWLEQDYVASMKKSPNPAAAASLRERVAKAYAAAEARQDPEASDAPSKDEKLPSNGMQIHSEYTLYAHFMQVKALTAGAEKVRFFLDQDSGMRAACLAAFADDIKAKRRVDAFFVKIAKDMTVDQKRKLKRKAEDALALFMETNPGKSKSEAILAMLKERLAAMAPIGAWNDRWVDHPFLLEAATIGSLSLARSFASPLLMDSKPASTVWPTAFTAVPPSPMASTPTLFSRGA